ncbi:MAG: Hsp70 family protein [Coriobacteriales bacterium]|nr:Hsp70 family protein [Coriobacteriales bacterium]
MGLRVGIDLGTTYSGVAYIDSVGMPRMIKNSFGDTVTPSVLCFKADGSVLHGEDAKNEQESGNPNVASFYKRSMGSETFMAVYAGKTYTPTDLSSIFLRKLVAEASESIGQPITEAVITVPAYFAARERQATIEVGERAGLKVLGLLSEPSAAAYAYGLNGSNANGKTIMIYDLGGGTFDVTIARITEDEVKVLGCDGDHQLGGKDWDDALARHLLRAMCDELGIEYEEINPTLSEMNALIVQAENAKRQLSTRNEIKLKLSAGGYTASVSITRNDFEAATEHLLRKSTSVIEHLLEELGLSWYNIDGSLLVGGSTRMPCVRSYLRNATGKEPLSGINADEAVALGAAIHANMIVQSKKTLGGGSSAPKLTLMGARKLSDSIAHAMGMIAESDDRSRYVNSIIIPKHTPIPARMTRSYKLRVPKTGGILEAYVLQGSNQRVLNNTVYAKYVVEGIEREGQGDSIVEVTYAYTENATIEVTAKQPFFNRDLVVRKDQVESDLSRFDRAPEALEVEVTEAYRFMVAIDVSGSMSGNPIREARSALVDFLKSVEETESQVGIMVFADECKIIAEPTDDFRRLKSLGKTISDNGDVGYGTSANPIEEWRRGVIGKQSIADFFFFKKKRECDYHDCLIVLTDGEWFAQNEAIRSAKAAINGGAEIIAIGFGSADRYFLSQIASSDDYSALIDLSSLRETFSTIGRTMTTGGGLTLKGK